MPLPQSEKKIDVDSLTARNIQESQISRSKQLLENALRAKATGEVVDLTDWLEDQFITAINNPTLQGELIKKSNFFNYFPELFDEDKISAFVTASFIKLPFPTFLVQASQNEPLKGAVQVSLRVDISRLTQKANFYHKSANKKITTGREIAENLAETAIASTLLSSFLKAISA